MQKIRSSDVLDLVAYEKVREDMRAAIIERKKSRRISVGSNLTFLFENRETVLFQIQEMVRTERIVDAAKIQDEIDAYNALLPESGELSATLFIEILDLHLMTNEQVRAAVNRFQGLDREGVWLEVGEIAVPARFESGHSKEEKMAAVHYIRFALSPEARRALAGSDPVRLRVDHPNYQAACTLPPELRAELLTDLRSPVGWGLSS